MTARARHPATAKPGRGADAGITLIEVLVVLAVIGVATGATMLGVNSADRGTRAEAEAIRLARHLTLGVDEALISGSPLALMWDAGGYRFVAWSGAAQSWAATLPPALTQRHDLRAPVTLSRPDTGKTDPVVIAASGTGPAIAFQIGSPGLTDTSRWIVDFDGFSATTRPERAP